MSCSAAMSTRCKEGLPLPGPSVTLAPCSAYRFETLLNADITERLRRRELTSAVKPAVWLHQLIMPNSTRIFVGGASLPNQMRCSWSYDASMLLTATVAVAAQQTAVHLSRTKG